MQYWCTERINTLRYYAYSHMAQLRLFQKTTRKHECEMYYTVVRRLDLCKSCESSANWVSGITTISLRNPRSASTFSIAHINLQKNMSKTMLHESNCIVAQ
jgi:hypothetical protein